MSFNIKNIYGYKETINFILNIKLRIYFDYKQSRELC